LGARASMCVSDQSRMCAYVEQIILIVFCSEFEDRFDSITCNAAVYAHVLQGMTRFMHEDPYYKIVLFC